MPTVVEGDLQGVLEERARLLAAVEEEQHHRLGVECLRELLGKAETLGRFERDLDALSSELPVAVEEVEPAELGGKRGEVRVVVLSRQHLEGLLHPLDAAFQVTGLVGKVAKLSVDTGAGMGLTGGVKLGERQLEMRQRPV